MLLPLLILNFSCSVCWLFASFKVHANSSVRYAAASNKVWIVWRYFWAMMKKNRKAICSAHKLVVNYIGRSILSHCANLVCFCANFWRLFESRSIPKSLRNNLIRGVKIFLSCLLVVSTEVLLQWYSCQIQFNIFTKLSCKRNIAWSLKDLNVQNPGYQYAGLSLSFQVGR